MAIPEPPVSPEFEIGKHHSARAPELAILRDAEGASR